MPFVHNPVRSANYATPEDLYRDLPRRTGAVSGLWSHQADILRDYTKKHRKSADVALELPTGTGKTLTGLLIAEWTRITRTARVVYACPTKQLARQVAAAARPEGIDTALLIGSHHAWPESAHHAYEAAEAIAVTSYSSVFNSHPALADADLIVFDDAHAGEQYVGDAYAVTLSRWQDRDDYDAMLTAVAPALDGVFVERLRAATADPGFSDSVRLVVPLRQSDMVSRVKTALTSIGGPQRFNFAMIRDGLASCLVYVSYSTILIRPYLPPTHQNPLFSGARQRLYLSATLGEAGELERAFGRPSIARLALEEGSTPPRYGRRFFVFPRAARGGDPENLARTIVEKAGKGLVLAPQHDRAQQTAAALAQPGWPVLSIDHVRDGMKPFADLPHATCGLASRYDGLDLPGKACRLIALNGLPNQNNLQERFLASRAHADVVFAERVRTRIVQGAGRCTRSPQDTAIVLILDADLSRYLGRPEITRALDPELQAELKFGRENSHDQPQQNILDNVAAFLSQDTDDLWREEAEPSLVSYRRAMTRQSPPAASALADIVDLEIEAWSEAHSGNWPQAARLAHQIAELLSRAGNVTDGYRSFWTYLQATWTDQAGQDAGDATARTAAQALIREAESIMGMGSWVREMAPLPAMARLPLTPADSVAVQAITARLHSGVRDATINRQFGEIHNSLNQTSAGPYEAALTELGKLLGADAYKPLAHGNCDSAWCFDNHQWIALEAKSEHQPHGVVGLDDVRQANAQLGLLAVDRSVPTPAISASVIISPRDDVHDDGIAIAHADVHLGHPDLMQQIAHDAASAWSTMLARQAGLDRDQLRELVGNTMAGFDVLPSRVFERLTITPIGEIPA